MYWSQKLTYVALILLIVYLMQCFGQDASHLMSDAASDALSNRRSMALSNSDSGRESISNSNADADNQARARSNAKAYEDSASNSKSRADGFGQPPPEVQHKDGLQYKFVHYFTYLLVIYCFLAYTTLPPQLLNGVGRSLNGVGRGLQNAYYVPVRATSSPYYAYGDRLLNGQGGGPLYGGGKFIVLLG